LVSPGSAGRALPYDVPPGLLEQRELGPSWARWLDRLPKLFAEVVEDWELGYDGPFRHGFCSLVAPVRTRSGGPAVLKVSFDGDTESEHEALALQHWAGRGAVRLLRADPRRRAMLLERLHPEDLCEVGDIQACAIVAGLYRRLHVPALKQLRTVASYVETWVDALALLPNDAAIPRRFVEQAVGLGRALVAEPPGTAVIVHGDLHYENVLASDREPWLAIDPKAMSGDPHYEPAPMLWNRWEELVASGNVRDAVRRRFHTIVDVAELDEERARDWVIVRMVLNAHWSIEDAERAGRPLDAEERDWITRCLTIAKAVHD
jgi:streptomycin 6-kinase